MEKKQRMYRVKVVHDKLWKPDIKHDIPEAKRADFIDKKLKAYLRSDFEVFSLQCVLSRFTGDVLLQATFWESQEINFRIVAEDLIDHNKLNHLDY